MSEDTASHDRIVVYSNGIADHRRHFTVDPGESRHVQLAVRRDHLADVLASLNVLGDVILSAPPSFQPADADAGNLSIVTMNSLEALACSLSGSRVEVERPSGNVRGTLLGLQEQQQGTAGEPIERKSLVVLTDIGLRNVPLDEITNLNFEEEKVRDEIAKALRRNFERIKPHSTFVELELTAAPDAEVATEAIVQYTLPAAAWKIAYRLRELGDDRYELQGFAVVTNDTDEDWKDVLVSVVTGEPITFSTDLAETKIPRRKHVDIVRDEALGNVEVDEGEVVMAAFDTAAPKARLSKLRGRPDMAVAEMDASAIGTKLRQSASFGSETTASDVGDFCVFESHEPVTIAARRSAVIPMFLETLEQSKTVLHYRLANHPERPFRSVDFTNRTAYSLGRGVCTVFQGGVYAGSCVLPALKPGEDRLLPHALETGVHVRREVEPEQRTLASIRISEGTARTGEHQRLRTIYHVRSHRDEPYRLVLDHDRTYGSGETEVTLLRESGETESIAPSSARGEGPRFELTIDPRESFDIRVDESRVRRSTVQLVRDGGQNVEWVRDFLVTTNGPLAEHPGVRECLAIKARVDEKDREIAEVGQRTERLVARQERLRDSLKAAGQGEQSARWRSDLAAAETQLVEIEETTLPRLEAEAAAIQAELRTALESLSAEWNL